MFARLVIASLVALAAFAPVGMMSCGGSSDVPGVNNPDSGDGGTVNLVAYATPKVAYDELIPAFTKTSAGRGTELRASFGASGDQSRAVAAGQPADIVTFSVAPDMTRLVEAGLVSDDWAKGPNRGRITTSVVTFIVRKGNPKTIRDWDDLLQPGIDVLTPSPQSSGAAKWNLLAAYGQAERRPNAARGAGLDYVRRLLSEHVTVQDKSAREALQSFIGGRGDVLLSFENEAITARKQGEAVDYVIPQSTINIDIAIAPTRTASSAAQAFLTYLLSEPAQRVFAEWGYRPIDSAVQRAAAATFPQPAQAFDISDLGGWEAVEGKLFDPQTGLITKIENEKGR